MVIETLDATREVHSRAINELRHAYADLSRKQKTLQNLIQTQVRSVFNWRANAEIIKSQDEVRTANEHLMTRQEAWNALREQGPIDPDVLFQESVQIDDVPDMPQKKIA